jgi:hypothetical protein
MEIIVEAQRKIRNQPHKIYHKCYFQNGTQTQSRLTSRI